MHLTDHGLGGGLQAFGLTVEIFADPANIGGGGGGGIGQGPGFLGQRLAGLGDAHLDLADDVFHVAAFPAQGLADVVRLLRGRLGSLPQGFDLTGHGGGDNLRPRRHFVGHARQFLLLAFQRLADGAGALLGGGRGRTQLIGLPLEDIGRAGGLCRHFIHHLIQRPDVVLELGGHLGDAVPRPFGGPVQGSGLGGEGFADHADLLGGAFAGGFHVFDATVE